MDRVQEILRETKNPPTIIVSSGRGIHAYWVLKTPTKNLIDHEMAIKGLARIFAGDRVVTHAAALMRLPGTVNSKDGGHREVTVISDEGPIYSFDVLKDWIKMADVEIHKKGEGGRVDFASFQVRPPVDVEGRLAAMMHKGEGDTSVHATQLSVTASLLNAGVSVEEVVHRVLSATKDAVRENWDWTAEENTIRRMCDSWVEKQPKQPVAQIINLSEAKAERKTKTNKQSKEQFYLSIAIETVNYIKKNGERFIFVAGEPLRYTSNKWVRLPSSRDVSFHICHHIQRYCSSKGILTNNKMISEIKRLITDEFIPRVEEIDWDNTNLIPFKNYLLDYTSGEVIQHNAENYLTRVINRDHDPEAVCPMWKQMLADAFPDEPDVIKLIQEIAGMGLLSEKSRALTTAMVLVGPASSGKSNILEVLGKIYSDSSIAVPIDRLEVSHGTMPFLSQSPWVLDEAFDTGTWHTSKTIKALLTGENIEVNIKNGAVTNIRYKAPVFWGANVMPQFKEMTEAIKKRLTVIRCKQIFDLGEPIGVAKRALEKGYVNPAELVIEEELQGIINWAIRGLKRASKKGRFSKVESVEESSKIIHESGNFAIGFLRDCTTVDRQKMISTTDAYGAFEAWWHENRGDSARVPSQQSLVMAIVSLHRKDLIKSPEKFNNFNYLIGISLSTLGEDYWIASSVQACNKNLVRRYSDSLDKINVLIPEKWSHIISN